MAIKTDIQKWYVLRTFSGHEKKVVEALTRAIDEQGLGHKIGEIVVPTETVFEMRNGKKRTKENVLYKGYVFIHALLDLEVKHLINEIPGATGFLTQGQGTEPAPLRPDEAMRMIGRMDEAKEKGEIPEIPFKSGDLVKVVDGPFNNFTGTVEDVDPDKMKVKVMVSIFGRRTPLELDYLSIEHTA